MSPITKGQHNTRILTRLLIAMMLLALTFTTAFAGEMPAAESADDEAVLSAEIVAGDEAEVPARAKAAKVNTASVKELPAWLTQSGKTYYLDSDGDVYQGGVYTIGGEKYYFDAEGVLQTGYIKRNKGVAYIANEDGEIKTGLFTHEGKTYYASSSGKLVRNKVLTVKGKKYFFGSTGAAKTGYIKKNKGIRYIANAKGVIKTGWVKHNGKKYYAKKSGVLTRNTMKKVGRKTYYFNGSGAMLKNKVKTIKGYNYKFGRSGALTKRQPTGATVAKFARQFNGNPYRSGGTSLTNGADCSGFTMAIYKHYGINLPHYSYSQMRSGKAVSKPKPGDIVIYRGGGHAALYIGDGKVIHAMNYHDGIKITSLTACGQPTCYRRILDL